MKRLDPEDIETTELLDKANAFYDQRKHDKATEFAEKALSISLKARGPEHPDVNPFNQGPFVDRSFGSDRCPSRPDLSKAGRQGRSLYLSGISLDPKTLKLHVNRPSQFNHCPPLLL